MSIDELKASMRKDTVFILGSGYSVNDITEAQWREMSQAGDMLSLNYFFRGRFVPIDYHICGDLPFPGSVVAGRKLVAAYYEELFDNHLYRDATIFLRYWRCKNGRHHVPNPAPVWALHYLKAFRERRVCLYGIDTNTDGFRQPSDEVKSVLHYEATLFNAVNIAYILGYKKIVLVGVDLYDRRYFWLGKDETRESDIQRGKTYVDTHNTANWVLEGMKAWNGFLLDKQVTVYIYNPRSLLNTTLPVYDRNSQVMPSTHPHI